MSPSSNVGRYIMRVTGEIGKYADIFDRSTPCQSRGKCTYLRLEVEYWIACFSYQLHFTNTNWKPRNKKEYEERWRMVLIGQSFSQGIPLVFERWTTMPTTGILLRTISTLLLFYYFIELSTWFFIYTLVQCNNEIFYCYQLLVERCAMSNANGKEQNSKCKNQMQTSFHNVQVNIFVVVRSHK